MRKVVFLLGLVLCVAFSAAAQDDSKVELFGGYSYLRFDPGNGIKGVNFNGGVASVAVDVSKHFAVVGELGGYHNGSVSSSKVTVDTIEWGAGPKFFVHFGKITPFAQGLLAGIHAKATGPNFNPDKATSLAGVVGGGIDLDVTKHIGVRLAQAEYVVSRFNAESDFGNSLGTRQNSFRYSAGIIIHP